MRRFEKLPNPQGVGENQTATVDLPLGPTYNAIYISLLASNGTARTIDQMKTLNGEDATAYGTAANMASFTLEVDLLAGLGTSRLEVFAKQSEPTAFGSHLRIQRFSDSMALVGEKEISDIPRGAYNMMALHITTGAIGNVEVLANNRNVHESTTILRGGDQRIIGRVPQAGYTHLDFMTENRLGEALPMVLNDFRLKLDVTAANQTFKILAVSVQGLAA